MSNLLRHILDLSNVVYAFGRSGNERIPVMGRINNSKGISGHKPSYTPNTVPKGDNLTTSTGELANLVKEALRRPRK